MTDKENQSQEAVTKQEEIQPEQTQVVDPEIQAEREARIKQLQSARSEETSIMNPTEWGQMGVMADTFAKSQSLPAHWNNPAKIMVGLQVGKEMGMKPMESLNSLYIVNGSVNIWGKATVRRLREHGYIIKYDETADSCTATVKKLNGLGMVLEEYKETMTFKDAESSGYTKDNYGKLKVGWREGQNRKLKLRYGALSALIKSYIPEVMGSAGDIQEVAQDFENVIDGDAINQPVEQVKPTISDVNFKKFTDNSVDYVAKHRNDFEWTENQAEQIRIILDEGGVE